jgi:hypothetical protein
MDIYFMCHVRNRRNRIIICVDCTVRQLNHCYTETAIAVSPIRDSEEVEGAKAASVS